MSSTAKRVVVVDARRTPLGRFRGGLANLSPVDLAVAAATPMLARLDRSLVDQVILGSVLSAGHGMNIARQVAINLELPIRTPAWTVNMMCGSGMQAALAAVTAIRAGEARMVLAGGTESMSQARLLLTRPGKNESPDVSTAVDSLLRDGLIDSFSSRHMGDQAEELAKVFSVSREAQDAFAFRSQQLTASAQAAGAFEDEIAAAGGLTADEHPRPENDRVALAKLSPVFRPDGSVTAGNSSGINDGAACLLLAEREFAIDQGWPALAEWIDGIVVGCDPQRMGLGPVQAIEALLQRSGRTWRDVDTLEINEAFAAQALACLRELQLTIDLKPDFAIGTESTSTSLPASVRTLDGHAIQFNAEGGAIALGHPLAASGARLLVHLAWKLARGQSHTAIGSLCIGGGMGIAALLTK